METAADDAVAVVSQSCEISVMENPNSDTAEDRLYLKALAIRHGRHVGLWLPIVWRLALRGHTGGMVELADWLSGDDCFDGFGKPRDTFSAAGLYYRAYRKGDARAANNAAMSCFNRNDMSGYRLWLRRAANSGDATAAIQHSHFECRLPHRAARKVGRIRTEQKRDEFA